MAGIGPKKSEGDQRYGHLKGEYVVVYINGTGMSEAGLLNEVNFPDHLMLKPSLTFVDRKNGVPIAGWENDFGNPVSYPAVTSVRRVTKKYLESVIQESRRDAEKAGAKQDG